MIEPTAKPANGSAALEPVAATGDALSGMAVLGKTAASLVLVVAAILLLAWLVRRFNLHSGAAAQHLRVVGSVAVGQRERVVLVEVDNTWLVLGVGGGQVTRLHELPAQPAAAQNPSTASNATGNGFAHRLAQVLARSPRAPDTSPVPPSSASPNRSSDGSAS